MLNATRRRTLVSCALREREWFGYGPSRRPCRKYAFHTVTW